MENELMIKEIERAINEICEKYNKEMDFYSEEIDEKIVLSIDIENEEF